MVLFVGLSVLGIGILLFLFLLYHLRCLYRYNHDLYHYFTRYKKLCGKKTDFQTYYLLLLVILITMTVRVMITITMRMYVLS